MKNRKIYLKSRRKKLKLNKIGYHYRSICEKCGQEEIYLIYEYDALCCLSCNEWLEKACSDPNCPFCSNRPDTPYEFLFDFLNSEFNNVGVKKLRRCENYQHKTNGMLKHKKRREDIENLCMQTISKRDRIKMKRRNYYASHWN